MVLNAPEHQPSVGQDLTIVEFAQEKMFSDPDKILAGIWNQCKKALLRNSSSRSRVILVINEITSRQGSSKGSETHLRIGTHMGLLRIRTSSFTISLYYIEVRSDHPKRLAPNIP